MDDSSIEVIVINRVYLPTYLSPTKVFQNHWIAENTHHHQVVIANRRIIFSSPSEVSATFGCSVALYWRRRPYRKNAIQKSVNSILVLRIVWSSDHSFATRMVLHTDTGLP